MMGVDPEREPEHLAGDIEHNHEPNLHPKHEAFFRSGHSGAALSQEEILFKLIRFDTLAGKRWAAEQSPGWDPDPRGSNGEELIACDWAHIACDPYTKEITKINLANQELELSLIPELENLKALMELNLNNNHVSGTIPSFLFEKLPNLQYLVLAQNDLEGTIPKLSSSMAHIRVFDVSENRLYGTIPEDIGDVMGDSVEKLDFSHNGFVGTIPAGIIKCRLLGFLDLSTNLLDGSIPLDMGELKNLEGLFLNNNDLVGTIPYTLARSDLPLIQVFLENNDLSGTVPAGFSDLSKLRNLFLDGNKLTGTLPQDLCRRDNPRLNSNFFKGEYSTNDRDGCTSIACPAGTVSHEGVAPCYQCDSSQYRYLGQEGRACHEMSQTEILTKFYDDTNGLNWHNDDGWGLDNVPVCQWAGVSCTDKGHIVNVTLAGKGLSGRISSELGLLPHLAVLNLANNALTGYLPSDLRFSPLEYLDVSNNRLVGFVPPMLCLTGNVNGNGVPQFHCDYVACPAGTFNEFGRQVTFENGHTSQCIPCLDFEATDVTKSFIGATSCDFPGSGMVSTMSGNGGGAAVGGTFLFFLVIGILAGFILMRRRQSKREDIDRNFTMEEQHLDPATSDDYDYEFDVHAQDSVDAILAKNEKTSFDDMWEGNKRSDSPEVQRPEPAEVSSPPHGASSSSGNNSDGSSTGGGDKHGNSGVNRRHAVRRQDSDDELWLDVPKIL